MNNLDKASHDTYLINNLKKTTDKKDKQNKSNKKLKHVHFSPIIFVKLVIPAGNRDRQSNNRLVKALVYSVASESIIIKAKAEKMTIKKTKQERQ